MTKSNLYTAALSAFLLQYALSFAPPPLHSTIASSSFVPRNAAPLSSSASSSSSTLLHSATTIDEVPSDVAASNEDSSSNSDPEAILQSRNRLVTLSSQLSQTSPSGKFIVRPADKIKLRNAVSELEALSSGVNSKEIQKEMLVGDWTLVATAQLPSGELRQRFSNSNGNDKSIGDDSKKKGWFNNNNKRRRSSLTANGGNSSDNPISKTIRKTVKVTQRIRTDGPTSSDESQSSNTTPININRVDNIIEISPLNTLEDVLPTSTTSSSSPIFDFLSKLNVNPLQVKKSKVVLIHKAEVESVEPVLRMKIAWTSSVVNVAGTSQFLDPEGEDIFGLNNLFGEFTNVGTFDTPYVDEDVRVSRTSGPIFDQLRVFVKSDSTLLDDDVIDSLAAELRVEEEKEVSSSPSYSENNDAGTKVKNVVDSATSLVDNARSTIERDLEPVADALGSGMDDVAARVQDAVEDDLESIRDAMEGVGAMLTEEGLAGPGEVAEAIANVTKAVVKVPGDVSDIVVEDATELGDRVDGALSDMVADVQDSVEADLKEVGKSIDEVRDVATGGEKEVGEDEEEK